MHICKVFYVFVCMVCEIKTLVKERVSWNLLKKPAVFTRDVQMECTISTELPCCNTLTRKWSRGRSYDLIVMNGVSLNTAKYKENLNISANTSTLTIYKFSEYDVNIPYECSYGFDSASHILELTEENFEYHPEEMLPCNVISVGQQVLLNITLEKVYPAPICTALDGVIDVTNNLCVQNDEHGLFLRSNIQFNYTINHVCHTTVEILCRIGRTKFAIVNGSRPCIIGKSDFTVSSEVTAMVIVCSIILVFNIAVLLWKKCRQSVNSNKPESSKSYDIQLQPESDRKNDNTNDIKKSESVETKVQQSEPLLKSIAKDENIKTVVHEESPTNPTRKKKRKKISISMNHMMITEV